MDLKRLLRTGRGHRDDDEAVSSAFLRWGRVRRSRPGLLFPRLTPASPLPSLDRVPTLIESQSSKPRDPALDGLRGVAVLLVYIFHYGGGLRSSTVWVRSFGYVTQAGWVGVELFFALSGFLITGILWDNRDQAQELRNFFARRGLRILPVYYGAIGLALLASLAKGVTIARCRPDLVYVFFLQNLPPLVPTALRYPPPLALNHLWSLAVEEQFYLLWPFLLLAASTRRRALQICLWTFGLSAAFRLALFSLHPFADPAIVARWAPFLVTRAGGLGLGGALALSRRQLTSDRLHVMSQAGLIGGVVVFAGVGVLCRNLLLVNRTQFVLALPAVEIASVCLVALALQPGPWRKALCLRPLAALGRISYGFYVLHILLEPVFDAVGRGVVHTSTGSTYQLVRLLAALPISAAAAWLSFHFLELPLLRLKRLFPGPASPSV